MITWISTKEKLPIDKRHVLVLIENSTNIINTGKFDHQTGWDLITSQIERNGCCNPRYATVLFWSEFNLPQ